MIKTILWDFDGVILNSMKIKGDAFVELFEGYSKSKVAKLEKYHYENGGMSRFEKIKYFFNDIINKKISDDDILQWADKFALIIEKKIYTNSNLIDDTLLFIKNNYQNYNFHIVSGSEHKELHKICKHFELDQFFISIDGSPIKKEILIKKILEKYNYKKEETILIGDSMNDYDAASINSVNFYGFNNELLKNYGTYIKSFKGFKIG